MLVEAKALAQIQCLDALMASKNCTLHTDGTKRKGHEYGGLQVGTESGHFSLGISDLPQGTAESFFKMIQTIFQNLSKLDDQENTNEKVSAILSTISNLMTDRHVVNTSLKNMLEKWKAECLPLVIDNFHTFPDEIKRKLININHFKYNLHVLVNLGSQAEAALTEWIKTIVISDTLSKDWCSTSTPYFFRAATKLCVPGADQKSGYGLLFKSYLDSLTPPVELKMSTFYGHRINILFSMAASVFYHASHIKDFTDLYFDKQNNLVSCVSNYVKNNVYLAGCRALGIIDKLCTGPLWRQIESAKHILDLNDIWFNFYNFLNEYSQDSSDLLGCKIIYPDFTEQDDVFDCLFADHNLELNILTIEALQVLCTNFLIIIKRQLGDNLPGGKYNIDTAENFKELRQSSSTVANTNIISERDFANLDSLRREKPNANTVALEGMILFTNNKTLNWLENLQPDKKVSVFKLARENAPAMIKNYREQKKDIKQKHIELLNKRKEEIMKKETKRAEDLIRLKQEINQYGGEWLCVKDMYLKLKTMSNIKKVKAVKAQIKYQHIVLKKNPKDKTVFHFSKQGKLLKLYQLCENLEKLITIDKSNSVSENETILNFEVVIHSKQKREQFMADQRAKILYKIDSLKGASTEATTCTNEPNIKRFKQNDKRAMTTKDTEVSTVNTAKNDGDHDQSYNFTIHQFTLGETVAIAYSENWYPGQVEKIIDSKHAMVKCLHPTNSNNAFRWPNKEDYIKVENIFIIDSGFEMIPKDSSCRSFAIPTIENINMKYDMYKRKYF